MDSTASLEAAELAADPDDESLSLSSLALLFTLLGVAVAVSAVGCVLLLDGWTRPNSRRTPRRAAPVSVRSVSASARRRTR